MRTAPDVHKIFVLIKAKNENAAADRLKNEVCFQWNCSVLRNVPIFSFIFNQSQ